MSLKWKYECRPCNLDMYSEVEMRGKKLFCPECGGRTLRIAGYKKEGNLAYIELLEKVKELEDRIKRLDAFLNEGELDRYLVS